jgi:succinate dehydrogenase / fumarate reductase cytochrome b subunit
MRVPDRTSEPLRRIHSLTGMVPLGVFLVEHICVNAFALAGPEQFRRVASALGGIPMVAAIEILGIALPLVVHVVLGILIATELPERGSREWPTRREIVQRATGLLLLPYLIYHVWSTRLSPDVLVKNGDLFEIMSRQVSGAGGLAFHAIGVALAAWHFGNGIPGFAERWGLARTPGAARAAARAGATTSAALAVLGVAALLAFSNAPPPELPTRAGFEPEATTQAAPLPDSDAGPAPETPPAWPSGPSDTLSTPRGAR